MDTKQKLEEITREIKKFAQDDFAETPDEFVSHVFLVSPRFEIMPIPFAFKNGKERQQIIRVIRYMIQKSDAIAVIGVMDAWTSPRVSAEAYERGNYVPPSRSPDRQECLVITCTSRVLKTSVVIRYTRSEGKIVLGEEESTLDVEDMNFGDLFRTTH